MKNKMSLILLGSSITFLLVSSIFFYKYVTMANEIPIKKIANNKSIQTITNTKVVKIYVPNDSLDRLVESDIEIVKENFGSEATSIFNAIKKQSNYQIRDENGDYYPFLDLNTTLLNSYLVGNKLYLNLSSNLIRKIQTKEQELLILYSLVNTYTSLDGISKVKILIDGVEVNKLKWYSLKTFYTQNLDI